MSNFVYCPLNRAEQWINLDFVVRIYFDISGWILEWGEGQEPLILTEQEFAPIRAALSGQTRPTEPQLPRIPDPVIVPPAVRDFDEKVSARGTVA